MGNVIERKVVFIGIKKEGKTKQGQNYLVANIEDVELNDTMEFFAMGDDMIKRVRDLKKYSSCSAMYEFKIRDNKLDLQLYDIVPTK